MNVRDKREERALAYRTYEMQKKLKGIAAAFFNRFTFWTAPSLERISFSLNQTFRIIVREGGR